MARVPDPACRAAVWGWALGIVSIVVAVIMTAIVFAAAFSSGAGSGYYY